MGLKCNYYGITITTLSPILGSQPIGKDAVEHLEKAAIEAAGKEDISARVAEERTLRAPDNDDNPGPITTRFYQDGGKPVYLNYQMKGMIKEAASYLNGYTGHKARGAAVEEGKGRDATTLQFRSKMGRILTIGPRIIPIQGELGADYVERPLRAETLRGPRVCLASSEYVKPGAIIKFVARIHQLPGINVTKDLFEQVMMITRSDGIGQWRNSGFYGMFDYSMEEIDEPAGLFQAI